MHKSGVSNEYINYACPCDKVTIDLLAVTYCHGT